MTAPAPHGLHCGCHTSRALTLPGVPESVREFRQAARQLAATPYQAEAAALCVSELVTNALLHSRSGRPGGSVTVIFDTRTVLPGELCIWVHDDGPRATAPARSGLPGVAESGYGLRIVAQVAADQGRICPADDTATSWCIVAAEPDSEVA